MVVWTPSDCRPRPTLKPRYLWVKLTSRFCCSSKTVSNVVGRTVTAVEYNFSFISGIYREKKTVILFPRMDLLFSTHILAPLTVFLRGILRTQQNFTSATIVQKYYYYYYNYYDKWKRYFFRHFCLYNTSYYAAAL